MKRLAKAGYEVEEHWTHPDPDVDETILHVVGHGVDTTVYAHDEETIGRLVAQETPAQLALKQEEEAAALAADADE